VSWVTVSDCNISLAAAAVHSADARGTPYLSRDLRGRGGSASHFQAICDSHEAEKLQVGERLKHNAEPVNLRL